MLLSPIPGPAEPVAADSVLVALHGPDGVRSMGRATILQLDDHPNLAEILGVLAQLAHIEDSHLEQLADSWRNTASVAQARRRALSPDSPLVVDVLAAFDAVAALYADDLDGDCDYVSVDPDVASTALKAVRDAIAAAYAKPVLHRGEYSCLIAAWRSVFPRPTVREPDLGPGRAEVKQLLGLLPTLAHRCHDVRGRRVYDGLLVQAMTMNESERAQARDAAFSAAVRTGRRRVWTLVRRSTAEGLGRFCPTCRSSRADTRYDDERVVELCADAACALLVSDAVAAGETTPLTAPLQHLIPLQRADRPSPT